MANVNVGDRIRMLDNDAYVYTVGGTTGTVKTVSAICADIYFDAPLDTVYTVDTKYVEVIESSNKESAMFDHDTARSGKIGAIKALRAFVPHLTLRDAKDIVESIGSVYSGDISDLRIRFDDLTAELERIRAEYNDLLTYVPTDKLIDLLRK